MQGISPKQTITNYKDGNQTSARHLLRRAWNQGQASGMVEGQKRVITPFRAVNNLGDFLSRKNYVCGGPNQVNASKPGLKSRIGSIYSNCDTTGVPGASCTPKLVSDSSADVRFKKQRAMNVNYNDKSLGGEEPHASYSADMAFPR